jgi:hypothetical protein
VKLAISPSQHGFLPNRSTTSNLGIITNLIARTLDVRGQVDVIYMDLSKAFDSVDHDTLLRKLSSFKFSTSLIKLFASYLKDRSQAVLYKEHISKEFLALSGVPQGSNLGPLLFLLLINDLPDCIKTNKLLYADDLKIFTAIRSQDDCMALQEDVDNILSWCDQNKLSVNISKCKSLSYTNSCKPQQFQYLIRGEPIDRTDTIKDLGVIFDSTLSFTEHIKTIVNDAYRNLGLIIRLSKDFENNKTLTTLYYSYVRPKLEYASVIWNPSTQLHSKQIEKIQSKFLRYHTYKTTGFYPMTDSSSTLAENFNILTLEQRRKLTDLLFLYKLLRNHIDSNDLVSMVSYQVPSSMTRVGNSGLLYCQRGRTNIIKKSPAWRMSTSYNDISKVNEHIDIFNMGKKIFEKAIIEQLHCN